MNLQVAVSCSQQLVLHTAAVVADEVQNKPARLHAPFNLYPGWQVTPVAEQAVFAVQHTVFLFVDVAAVPALAAL
jgi:hypothetical protein